MNIQLMPGPTDEARGLQLAQSDALEAFYDACMALEQQLGHQNRDAILADPRYTDALAKYDATVAQLEALLGPDAHCNFVDMELWGQFSDWYKSEEGFRPRGHMTRAQVKAALSTSVPA